MHKKGHTVYHYGHKDSEVDCPNIVISDDDFLGRHNVQNWQTSGHDQFVGNSLHFEFNSNAIRAMSQKVTNFCDIICCFWGFGHEQIADFFDKKAQVFEASIGYNSYFARYKAFESFAHMTQLTGLIQPSLDSFVVPPGFYEEDFAFSDEKEDYIVFLGRLVEDKGFKIAIEVQNPSLALWPQN
jgi:glycosyltransferase involved in cell wall biosynthesis